MQHAPDIDCRPLVELVSTSSCTSGGTCAIARTAPRERLNCGAATRREVDDDPRPVAEADEHLDLCRQPRRAHVKSFLRRAAGGRETRFSPANQHFDPGPISRKIRRCGGGGRPPGEAAGAGEAAIRWVAATTVLVCQCGLDGRGTRAHYGARFRARSDGALWGSRGADTAPKQGGVSLQMGCQFRVQGQRQCVRGQAGVGPPSIEFGLAGGYLRELVAMRGFGEGAGAKIMSLRKSGRKAMRLTSVCGP